MKPIKPKQNEPKSTLVATTYSGPIPSAAELANYEKIHPGFAERIIAMAEAQGKHRREMEEKALNAQIGIAERHDKESQRGQLFAFIISIISLLISAALIWQGYFWGGALIGGSTLGVIVCAFIYGRDSNIDKIVRKTHDN